MGRRYLSLSIRYPKVTQAGSESSVPVTGADFYPTILELCDLPLRPEQHVDGCHLYHLLAVRFLSDLSLALSSLR